MAKRRKKAAAPKRRRRVSGVGSANKMLEMAAYAIAGGVGAYALIKLIPASVGPKIASAGAAAAGILLVPRFVKGPTGIALALGAATIGGVQLVQSTGILKGIGSAPMIAGYRMAKQLNGIGGNPPMVAGPPPSVAGNGQAPALSRFRRMADSH